MILGSGEYARIKTGTVPLVGEDGDPVAELTKLGWFVMSPGADFDKTTVLMTQTSQSDYENLCRLDVLGIADSGENDQEMVYQDFKEQLGRSPDGWYEANLPWKPHHALLATNEQGSRRRLEQLVKKLRREGNYDSYDQIIQDQLQQGVIEPSSQVVGTGVSRRSERDTGRPIRRRPDGWRLQHRGGRREESNNNRGV
jgi:hypothetical protein